MRTISCVLLLCAALFIGACGNKNDSPAPSTPNNQTTQPSDPSAQAPTPTQMLVDAVKAPQSNSGKISLKFDLTGQSEDPQIDAFLNQGLSFNLNGASSDSALDFTGAAKLLGKNYDFAIKGDKNRSFVQFRDVWYGPGPGILKTASSSTPNGFDPDEAAAAIQLYGDKILEGSVTEGDEVDGQPTWKFDGKLNADGIIQLIEEQQKDNADQSAISPSSSNKLSKSDKAALKQIVDRVTITVVTGQEDKRFRQVQVVGELTESDFEKIAAEEPDLKGKSTSGKLTFDLGVTDYDTEAPTLQAPKGAKPWAELQQVLTQELFGALGATGGGGSPTTPPTTIPEVPAG